ncbi:MAG: DNRLRE domain-containing protein, partial [Thermoplasmata archaeon]|nr:DNRLRE domain-containing protein [Thermoplasmata archaeon]
WSDPGGFFDSTTENETDVGASNAWYDFDITEVVSKWHTNQVDNYGILVKYDDEAFHAGSFKTFYSSDYTTADRRPKLSVEYDNSPVVVKGTAPDQWSMQEDQNPNDLAVATVFGDADGQDTLAFSVWTGSDWGTTFDDGLLTATLKNKGSSSEPAWYVEFALKPDQYGSTIVTLNATDQIRFATHDINVIVSSVNDDPMLSSIGNQLVTEEVWFDYEITAVDIEGNTLSFGANVTDYSSSDYLDTFTIEKDINNPNRAEIKYYPNNDDAPYVYVNITVEDGVGGIDNEEVKFTVKNVNDAPDIIKVAGEQPQANKITLYATEAVTRNFIVEAEDDDIIHGDELTFTSDVPNSENFTLWDDTGVIFFKPDNIHVPEFNVRVTVKDKNGSSDYVEIKFIVTNVNNPPVITDLVEPLHNAQFTTTDVIHFEAEYDDPDLQIPDSTEDLNVTWFSDIEGAIGYGAELDTTLSAGTHNITFKVKDNDPNTEAAKITFTVKVTKAITLTDQDCERDYSDEPADVVSYYYNIDKESMEYEKGGVEDNLDIIILKSKRIGNNLEIRLQVNGLIDFSKTYIVYLVMQEHWEPEDFYKITSSNVYDRLYKPNSTIIYGELPEKYRRISDTNDEFIYTINLGDLEAGDIDGFTKGLDSNFGIFAIAKGRETEPTEKGLYSVVSYDSAGWGAAYPGDPPVIKDDGDDSETADMSEYMGWAVIVVIIVIVILLVLFLFKRRKKESKVDIDYTGSKARPQAGMQQPP